MAAGLALAQLRAQMALPEYARAPALGLVYITDRYAAHAADILNRLAAELPGVGDWAGTCGVGVCATDAEYFDEPALSVMLCDLPRDQFRVYSGIAPLPPAARFSPQMALVHADGNTPELADLIDELAGRTGCGYLFGGLAVSRTGAAPQYARSGQVKSRGQEGGGASCSGVFSGGLSGVAFGRGVTLASRVAQGCQPITSERLITAAEDNVILTLDNQPALDILIDDVALDLARPHQALAVLRQTLVGLVNPGDDGVRRTGDFGPGVQVRSLIGIDAKRRTIALADNVARGQRLAFCRRDAPTARAELVRVCAEIREALEPQEELAGGVQASAVAGPRILGAHYVSCAGRGGAYFGAPGAELRIIRQALGDVPLTGFFASGEIAYRYLYGYSGVLTVFAEDAADAEA